VREENFSVPKKIDYIMCQLGTETFMLPKTSKWS